MLEQHGGGSWLSARGFGSKTQLLTTAMFYCKGPLLTKPYVIRNWQRKEMLLEHPGEGLLKDTRFVRLNFTFHHKHWPLHGL